MSTLSLWKELKSTKKNVVKFLKGYHFVLQIIYFKERYEGKSLDDPNAPPPWIQWWCGDKLKEKTKAEDKDITGLIQRAKMRARREKEEGKRQEGRNKKEKEDSQSMKSEFDEDSEEEEYQTTDSKPEPEPEPEVHQRQIREKEERSRRRGEEKAKKDKEPTLTKEFDHPVKRKQPRKEGPNKKKKTGSEEGATNTPPQMDIPMNASTIPEPQPPEPIIELGPEPQELIDGYVVACEMAEKINEHEKEAADVEIKAYEEAEIDLAIRKAVESVVVRAQEKEVDPELKKMQLS
ncbi:hypothetical protein PIB30_063292 [Stylosanthes scabra]|uniref:Uncharacterized protein n=1 Tax=Stylosanthes scabra TaxID=79078 RepID=A0ABU6YIW2_9FABA|nr:hypothetical protein [Stylosanthes scabra]